MTLNKFIKKLQKLQTAGHGRRKVCAYKSSFDDSHGDFSLCEVHDVAAESSYILADDGGIATRKDGSERTQVTIELTGDRGNSGQMRGRDLPRNLFVEYDQRNNPS